MGLFRRGAADPPEPVVDEAAPGWDAIDEALRAVYGDQPPAHVGYGLPAVLSHNLQGCSAYGADGHWHYISYGLSELYEPHPDDDPLVSGWGFELTWRISRGPEDEAPRWPFVILNELAKHVNEHGIVLAPGSRMDFGRPVTGYPDLADAPNSGLTVMAFTRDPELGDIDSPNGAVTFLQVVGVTPAEKDQMMASSTAAVLDQLRTGNELLITDPGRA